MAYIYANRNEVKELNLICRNFLLEVQEELREYFTYDFRLIGSGEIRLVTQNGEDGEFDLDYNIILQKDKKDLINNPKRIKEIFLKAFNSVNSNWGFKPANNSSSVITAKLILDNRLKFSFDVAIVCEGNNGNYYKIFYDKGVNRYIWNEIKHSKGMKEKMVFLKQKGKWDEIKKLYLFKKNYYLRRNDDRGSFSILIETINELYSKHGK